MQIRRQQGEEGSSFGKPLPKALQNSPYAASGVMAPGLHKKIARKKSSDMNSSTSSQRQLSRGESDHSGKFGYPPTSSSSNYSNNNPSELFDPSSNQKRGLLSPRPSALVASPPDGVVAYRSSTIRSNLPNNANNSRISITSPRGSSSSTSSSSSSSSSSNSNISVALPNVKGSVVGPSIALLKATNPKIAGNSKSTTSIRSSNHHSSRELIDSHAEEKSFKMRNVGLANLGNTCFMNAPLQCILHIKPFVMYFNSGLFEQDINIKSPTKGKLACCFGELVRDIFSHSSGSSLTPTRFKKEITKLAPHLMDFEQQDCQEFLRFLLDGLSEDLGRIRAENLSMLPSNGGDINCGNIHSDAINTNNTNNSVVPVTNNLLSLALGSGDYDDTDAHMPSTSIDVNRPQPPSIKSSLPDKFRSKIRSVSGVDSVNDTQIKEINSEQRCKSGSILTEQDIPVNNNAVLDKGNPVTSAKDTQDIAIFKKLQQRESGRRDVLSDNLVQVIKESSQSWNNYMKKNDSIITDIFGGQLQSTIECLTCHHRSHCFDPFLDLSVPIELPPNGEAAAPKSKFGSRRNIREPSSCLLEDCFASYSATEILEGDNAYNCEKCKSKQKSSKRLAIFKYPQVLIIHIKRFRFTAIRREKINTDVKFPASGLNLKSYLSSDSIELSHLRALGCKSVGEASPPPVYDLIGVANHSGGMSGGHYVAHVDAGEDPASRKEPVCDADWKCFNDNRVSQSSVSAASGPSAYMLFYRRRDGASPAPPSNSTSKLVQI